MNKLTIMMNCLNGEKFLAEALNSIKNQSFKEWNLYFFDNHSTDDSKKIFNSYSDSRFKYFYFDQTYDLGIARQKAWTYINSEYVAICDVDDVSLNNRFQDQVHFLDYYLDYGVVGSNAYLIDDHSNIFKEIKYSKTNKLLNNQIEYKHVFNSATLMFRKKAVDEIGGYNSNYEMINDYELLYKISRKFKLGNINKTLVCNRQHKNNLSLKKIVKGQIELLIFYLSIFKNSTSLNNKINLIKNILITCLRIFYHSIKSFIK